MLGTRDDLANRLGQLEAVVQNQDNREHDLLDSDDYYQFQGGMSLKPERPKVRTLKARWK